MTQGAYLRHVTQFDLLVALQALGCPQDVGNVAAVHLRVGQHVVAHEDFKAAVLLSRQPWPFALAPAKKEELVCPFGAWLAWGNSRLLQLRRRGVEAGPRCGLMVGCGVLAEL